MYENEIYSSDTGRYTTYQTDGTAHRVDNSADNGNDKKKKGVFRKILLSAALGLIFGLFAGAGFYSVQLGTGQTSRAGDRNGIVSEGTSGAEEASGAAVTNVNQITYVQDDVSDVVEEVMPAMVTIANNYITTGITIWGQAYSQPGTSSGSGIIVAENDSELLIVSNNHVVEGAEKLEVTFIDGSTAEASIKGLDSDMDLAVIAVALDSLSEETRNAITIAALGDSDALKLGTPVIAIGNALGFGQSVTTGIVSALNREISMEDGSVGTFIQTDAAINQGNSGGALLNINGEVIGINSSKIGGTMVEGMGYAIPISSASPIVAELMERETRVRVDEDEVGYMGITMQDVTGQHNQMFGMPKGVYVYSVEEGSPAEQAGIRRGDIIVKFDGARVSSYTDIEDMIQYYRAGDTATVTIERIVNGEYELMDLEVILGKRPEGR